MISAHTSFRSNGFTLIELMVVLLLIGIVVSLVFPRMVLPENMNDLATHHKNIQNIIRLSREESITRGRILGLFSEEKTVKVKRLLKGEWVDYMPSANFRQYSLPSPFSIEVRADKSPFKLPSEGLPPIVLLPDGQSTSFELVITNGESNAQRIIDSHQVAKR